MKNARPRPRLIEPSRGAVIDHAEELTALDQAIGDGDHGLNMKRGFEAVLADLDALGGQAAAGGAEGDRHDAGDEGRRRLGPALRHAVHGARQGAARRADARRTLAAAFAAAIEAVKARGKSDVGQKTMLDVLVPVARCARRRRDGAPRRRCAARCGRRGDDPDEGDPRPRLVPRRALDRPYGSRRALERADHRGAIAEVVERRA